MRLVFEVFLFLQRQDRRCCISPIIAYSNDKGMNTVLATAIIALSADKYITVPLTVETLPCSRQITQTIASKLQFDIRSNNMVDIKQNQPVSL